MSTRVLIAGGGLGGLTLAHGLRKAGIEPAVFERGPARADLTTSYRIHIDATGSRALYACLPPDRWLELERRSAASPRGIAFTTEQLDHLAFIAETGPVHEPVAHAHPISRAGLRQLLLSGLEDVVAFDKAVVRYERSSDGQVVVHLADGTSARGDVLVGADGSASAIRKQLLPEGRVVDTGVAGIAGKVYLTEQARQRVGPRLLSQMTMVLPLRGMAMFMAPFQRRADQPESADALDLPEHLFWVLLARGSALGLAAGSRQQSARQLQQLALQNIDRWHPLLRWLVEEADQASVVGVPLYTSQPVAPWRTTNVTLLGDAIHTMTPLQGLGGNTALRDAAVLCDQLVEADRGRTSMQATIGAYEGAMRKYGFDAVQRSLQVSNAVASTNIFGRLAFRSVLRAADRWPLLHKALFQRSTVALRREAELARGSRVAASARSHRSVR